MKARSAILTSAFVGALLMAGPSAASAYTAQDAAAGAQLRAEASLAVSILYFPCHSPTALAEPLVRYETFKAGLVSEAQKTDLAIVEADFDYQMSLVDIACPDPDAPETQARDDLNASIVNSVLDRMELLVLAPANADGNKGLQG